jgi:hypothetical protein
MVQQKDIEKEHFAKCDTDLVLSSVRESKSVFIASSR